jgi:hypothetical protein
LGLGIFLVFYGVIYQNRNIRASRTSTVLTATPFERRRRVGGVGWTISRLPGKLLHDPCAGLDFLDLNRIIFSIGTPFGIITIQVAGL